MNQLPSFAHPVSEYVRLELPLQTQLFVVNEHLDATVASRHTSISGSHRLAIHQFIDNRERVYRIQIFTEMPLESRFRILLLDWDTIPRNRAIMGYLLYERMAGVLQVSDYRMSLAQGVIPNIFRNDTVYMLGIRFEGMRSPVPITSSITDSSGISYSDMIIAQRMDTFVTFVSADRTNTLRPNAQNNRVIDCPTRVTPVNTAAIEEVVTTTTASTTVAIANFHTPTVRMIRPFVPQSNLPLASVLPFRPNTDHNLYRNYPDLQNVPGTSDDAIAPPRAEQWNSDDEWDTRDFRQ